MSAWAVGLMILGVLIVMATDTAGKGEGAKGKGETTTAGQDGEDEDDGGADLKPGEDGKYTQEQLDAFLGLERDRLDMKGKDLQKQFDDAVTKRVKEEQDRADMSDLQKAQADLASTQAERDDAIQKVAAAEAQQTRSEWIAANAGDLDRAWRSYLAQQLADAPETETPDSVLARVREERDNEQGGSSGPLGVVGRPGGQPGQKGTGDMNRAIRQAARGK